MLKELIKSLNATKAHVEALEAKVEKGLKKTLATIHAEHGFQSVDSFINAVKAASKEAGWDCLDLVDTDNRDEG